MSRRRGGHEDGGAHGGSWKIALADLMTVLMVFFLVMWLVSVVDPSEREAFVQSIIGEKSSTKVSQEDASIKGEDLNPLDLKPPATTMEIQQALGGANQKDIDTEDTPEFTKITLRSDSFFESGRATINERTRLKLEMLGETLAGRGQRIRITGYTDSVPINTLQFPSNWELSAARAATVARTFIYMGLSSSLVAIEGRAENEAIAPNDSPYGRSLNRRVIILVDKTGNPSF